MSAFSQRPVGIPFHAAGWTEAGGDNIGTARESIFRVSGYPPGFIVPSKDHNTKLQSSAFWLGYLDCNGIRNDDWLDAAAIRQLTLTKLSYTVTDSVTGGLGAEPETRTVIMFEGTRVETDVVVLTTLADPDNFARAADPLFVPGAPVPGRIWIYVTGDGKVRVDSVGVGVVDSPAAGQITLRGVDIDGAGLITDNVDPITLPLPARELPVRVPITFTQATFSVSVDIAGTLDVVGITTLGVTDVNGASMFTADVTVDAMLTVTNGNVAAFTGNVTLGATSGDSIIANGILTTKATTNLGDNTGVVVNVGGGASDTVTVRAAAGFDEDITIAAAKSITGPADSSVSVGTVTANTFFVIGTAAAPTATRQFAATTADEMTWRRGADILLVHHSTNGFNYATGQQEAAFGPFSTVVGPTTAVRTKPQVGSSGNVIVIAEGWGQRAVSGSVQLQVQQSDAGVVYSDAGASVDVEWVNTSRPDLWSYFRIERTLSVGTVINRLFRLEVDALGGSNASIRESSIRVVPEQY